MNPKLFKPFPEEVEEARKIYQGWVYRISGKFSDDERIPPEAVMGAWEVVDGEIQGDFTLNEKYDIRRWPPTNNPY